jgi:acetamidase/formamidase
LSTLHHLGSGPDTVHWGFLDAKLPPVLRVKSGDRVSVDCISGGPQAVPASGYDVLPEYHAVHSNVKPYLGPHILTGPIWVEGAEPGDTLEVRILETRLRQDWGYNLIRPLGGALPEDFPIHRFMCIPISRDEMLARLPWGAEVPLSPFFGVIATAPPAIYGSVTSMIPREFGGNLDNKELVAGSTLYLPIFVPGALFSVGDGHAVQGDGEVCTTALETAMGGTFELVVRKDMKLKLPQAESPTHYITMGLDEDLDDAAKQATREMILLLERTAGLTAENAYTLMSLACDLRVTQLVDGNKGIHAMILKSIVHGNDRTNLRREKGDA